MQKRKTCVVLNREPTIRKRNKDLFCHPEVFGNELGPLRSPPNMLYYRVGTRDVKALILKGQPFSSAYLLEVDFRVLGDDLPSITQTNTSDIVLPRVVFLKEICPVILVVGNANIQDSGSIAWG
nr:hypothetical protein [Mesorhizobium sp. CO1-1-8]